ncbi:LLM class F420-dependent oxidoreductase [Streptomyces europaeiscabiei]|uniref:LLM class F420-dependent oxidoreductase n=1 Tax=Streptomyces europaeiscabiei TaxID=146819 RepID=UPI002E12D6AD|nr:LLM class F420-dependent oxidoreductase [Streptomyces europaeiscabiei]
MAALTPTVGLFGMNMNAAADPAVSARIARRAEELGYESLWVADHVVLPRPRTEDSPLEPDTPLLDPVVALTHLASHTERIRLGTGCVVLPQRNPVVLAKQLASLDVISGGRLLFGAGVGYLEPEMSAVGVPMAGRGARADEYLQAISALWYLDKPVFHGSHADFEDVDARPRPLQRRVPLVIGGHSAAAHRRAVAHGDEWFGYLVGLRSTAEQVRRLTELSDRAGRQNRPLKISVAPARPLDVATVRAYAELGVDRLVVVPPMELTASELEEFVERHAPRELGAAPARETSEDLE